jgi:hypothetical protein
MACDIHWKTLEYGYNFVLDLIVIGALNTKLWGPKVARVPTLVISKLPLGSPKTKSHLDVGLVERHIVYYKGEGGDFPQVWAVVSLVNPSLPVVNLVNPSLPVVSLVNPSLPVVSFSTKSVRIMH